MSKMKKHFGKHKTCLFKIKNISIYDQFLFTRGLMRAMKALPASYEIDFILPGQVLWMSLLKLLFDAFTFNTK